MSSEITQNDDCPYCNIVDWTAGAKSEGTIDSCKQIRQWIYLSRNWRWKGTKKSRARHWKRALFILGF